MVSIVHLFCIVSVLSFVETIGASSSVVLILYASDVYLKNDPRPKKRYIKDGDSGMLSP